MLSFLVLLFTYVCYNTSDEHVITSTVCCIFLYVFGIINFVRRFIFRVKAKCNNFCVNFPSVLWNCWLGDRKGIWTVKIKMSVGLLVTMIWLELHSSDVLCDWLVEILYCACRKKCWLFCTLLFYQEMQQRH